MGRDRPHGSSAFCLRQQNTSVLYRSKFLQYAFNTVLEYKKPIFLFIKNYLTIRAKIFWDCFWNSFGTVLKQSSFGTVEDRVVIISFFFLAVLLTGIIKINIFAVNRLGTPKVCRSAI